MEGAFGGSVDATEKSPHLYLMNPTTHKEKMMKATREKETAWFRSWRDRTIRLMKIHKLLPLFLTSETSSHPYVFVTGVPRSGTVLIKSIMQSHSKIGGCEYETTSLLGPPRYIDQWSRKEISNEQFKSIRIKSDNIVQLYDKVKDKILSKYSKSLFIDKIQTNRFRVWYINSHFPKARWIHIVRDPRDGYCSARQHRDVSQDRDIATWISYWKRITSVAESISPNRRLTVRYEELTQWPEHTVRRIMDFLGEEFEERQIDPSTNRTFMKETKEHSRLTEPISPQSVGRWREELSEEEREQFEEIYYYSVNRHSTG
jgi:hypothetical protein